MKLLRRLNVQSNRSIVAPFVISRGDEFQGLLSDAVSLPDMFWNLEEWFTDTDLHIGIGYGILETPVTVDGNALALDGPAFHNARHAIEDPRSHLGGVFKGFGDQGDPIINGFARILHRHRARLSDRQREILGKSRSGASQTSIAEMIGRTKQAVSAHFQAAGVEAYEEAETGWRAALDYFTQPPAAPAGKTA